MIKKISYEIIFLSVTTTNESTISLASITWYQSSKEGFSKPMHWTSPINLNHYGIGNSNLKSKQIVFTTFKI